MGRLKNFPGACPARIWHPGSSEGVFNVCRSGREQKLQEIGNKFMCTNNMRCSIILFKRDHVNLHRNHATQNNCSASTDHGGAFGYRFSQNFIACLVTWMYRCRSSTWREPQLRTTKLSFRVRLELICEAKEFESSHVPYNVYRMVELCCKVGLIPHTTLISSSS